MKLGRELLAGGTSGLVAGAGFYGTGFAITKILKAFDVTPNFILLGGENDEAGIALSLGALLLGTILTGIAAGRTYSALTGRKPAR